MFDETKYLPEAGKIDPEQAFVVITPTHRVLNAGTTWCIEAAHRMGMPFIWRIMPGDALITRARSIAATWVLEKSPFDYAIFLDSDIVFQPQDLWRLFLDMKEKHYELIGGVYTVRSAKQLAHYPKGDKIHLGGEITEVEYLSTGFTGFGKAMLKKIVEANDLPICHAKSAPIRCYPFFESTAQQFRGEWILESEDWDFCRKARKAGITPYVDTGIRLGHEGSKVWGIPDMSPDVRKDDAPSLGKLYLPKNGKSAAREPLSRLALPR